METTTAYQYTDNEVSKNAQAVKQEFSYNDVVKTESNIPFKTSDNRNSKTPHKVKSDKDKQSKYTVLTYGGGIVKEQLQNKAENSEDNGVKTIAIGVGAVETAVEILKPEIQTKITKGDKRKTVYNKAQIFDKTKNLSIKSELKNQLKNNIVQMNNSSRKALKTGGSAIVKAIKDSISAAAENDLGFKCVDDAIKTVDTAVAVEKGVKATINTGKNTVIMLLEL